MSKEDMLDSDQIPAQPSKRSSLRNRAPIVCDSVPPNEAKRHAWDDKANIPGLDAGK